MKKVLAFVLCLALALTSVSAMADGVYTALYGSEVSTLNYLIASTEWDQTVAANIVDTLVEYNNIGELIPDLATSWECSEDGLTWTFHLRENVKWYDYTGKPVADLTANDFVAAAKYVLTAENESAIEATLESAKILNAAKYFAGEVTDFAEVGVKAVDDLTLQYVLEAPVPYFVSMTTYGPFMPAYAPMLEELGKDFGTDNTKLLYNGAYIMTGFEPQVGHTYEKNQNYWDAEHVYIEGIERIYNAEAGTLSPIMAERGEVDTADLDNDIIGDWQDRHPELITRGRSNLQYSYYYCFNFNPTYDEEYEPEKWLVAVNNANFRHSIMSAMDRTYGMRAEEPDDPDALLLNTVTPTAFATVNGRDFSTLDAFANTAEYFFNTEKALEYKAAAMAELGDIFPVTVVLSYKSSDSDWENEVQLVKAQLEEVLGTDYINVVLWAGPSDNFLSETRRAGKYSLLKCNWGADYADPETWAEPFDQSNSYNRMYLMMTPSENYESTKNFVEANPDVVAPTVAFLNEYYAAVDAAKAETADTEKRYNLFADAEAMLIENAIIIPYRKSITGYQVTKLNVYEGEYSSFGLCNLRFKFQHLYDEFVTAEQNAAFFAEWQASMGK